MSIEVCELVITAPDPDWLVAFSQCLVADHLAASAHHSRIRSIYRWEGEVHDKPEGRVALHTRQTLVPTIIERTRKEHPYQVPGIFTLPILDGSPDYLDWILQETTAALD